MGIARCWVHCIDCGEREMIPKKWLDRKRLRCRACGGYIVMSDQQQSELTANRDRISERLVTRSGKIDHG